MYDSYYQLIYIFRLNWKRKLHLTTESGPVVQSIVSLTSSLRGRLVKCFTTLLSNTLIFFVDKMREAFALQKLLTFYQQNFFNKTLTNDIVSFEQAVILSYKTKYRFGIFMEGKKPCLMTKQN